MQKDIFSKTPHWSYSESDVLAEAKLAKICDEARQAVPEINECTPCSIQ